MTPEASVPVDVQPFSPGTERDEYGNSIDTWGPRETRMAFCWWNPSSTEPGIFGRDAIDADVAVLAPWTCDARDRVWIGEQQFEIAGTPNDWNHGPFGWQPGYQINLKAVTG